MGGGRSNEDSAFLSDLVSSSNDFLISAGSLQYKLSAAPFLLLSVMSKLLSWLSFGEVGGDRISNPDFASQPTLSIHLQAEKR